jgi:hypothetical protein
MYMKAKCIECPDETPLMGLQWELIITDGGFRCIAGGKLRLRLGANIEAWGESTYRLSCELLTTFHLCVRQYQHQSTLGIHLRAKLVRQTSLLVAIQGA